MTPRAARRAGSLTLAVDGSTYAGSVALIRNGDVVEEHTLSADDGGIPAAGRGERLLPAIAECIATAGASGNDVARIVCGAGPGSFTSLRVAASVAKGLAVGYGVQLYAVPSLILTVAALQPRPREGDYLSLLDAMRGECYAARIRVSPEGRIDEIERARIISSRDLEALSAHEPELRLIGPAQAINARPHARGVARLLDRLLTLPPVELGSWEPDYGRLPEAQVRWEAAQGRTLIT